MQHVGVGVGVYLHRVGVAQENHGQKRAVPQAVCLFGGTEDGLQITRTYPNPNQ